MHHISHFIQEPDLEQMSNLELMHLRKHPTPNRRAPHLTNCFESNTLGLQLCSIGM